jgi:hypothetical protein
MEASQHSLLAACFTLHSINATLAIVTQRGAGLWIWMYLYFLETLNPLWNPPDEANLMADDKDGVGESPKCHI